jgi:hypothetical protein
MPLKSGATTADMQCNIKELIKAGHPQKQSVAIAFKMLGKRKKKSGKA